ncbi:MAG: hypothetical protein NZV14_17075 [Bryobacteraceae bacterium]|nr:hypothetical protein [Bryobacteraceae bacterium]MDW8379876.1 hypothetical protein [Bryobacterales bacterium]
MRIFALFLRIFSFVYHIPVALLLLAFALFAILDDAKTIRCPMVSWTGPTLIYGTLALAAAGIVGMALSLMRKTSLLFVLYAVAFLAISLHGALNRFYRGMEEFQSTLWILFGALGAVFGALFQFKQAK